MSSKGLLKIYGPDLEGNLGQCYQCSTCGRIYSPVLGYFYFQKGEGMRAQRPFLAAILMNYPCTSWHHPVRMCSSLAPSAASKKPVPCSSCREKFPTNPQRSIGR